MRSKVNIVYILLILSIVLIIVSTWITYENSRVKKESNAWIIHTYQVIQNGTNLQQLVESLEADQRGYIITQDSSFLTRYRMTKRDIATTFDSLTVLKSYDDRQTDLLENKIGLTIENREATLERGIEILHRSGIDSASAFIATKRGKAEMDNLRIFIKDLVNHEKRLLKRRNELYEKKSRNEDVVRLIAFITIGVTSVLSLLSLIRKSKYIDNLLLSLEITNESLEHKVVDRTQELTKLNKDKDHFIGIASHDLKAPLSGILGLIRLMKMENPNRPDKDLEYLSYIEDTSIKMQRLISNLLDINRIERGMSFVNKQPVNLETIFKTLEMEFTEPARKKSIKLLIDKIGKTVVTDPDVLKRILDNLLSNAIKFSPARKEVKIGVYLEDDFLHCQIIDQGPGISNEDLPFLFEKFRKLSNRPTDGEVSTGLGLSIVKELITLLDGDMEVESEVGKGTTFKFKFPIKEYELNQVVNNNNQ